MRSLVTGGAGFIGSHLVEALLARGDQVTVLDDLSSGSMENLPAGITLVRADVADPRTIDLIAAQRPSLVFHLAAQVSVVQSVADPDHDRAVNVVGTRHVLEGAAEGAARRIVVVSSGGAIYGEARLATEESPAAPESPYGAHKLAAERDVALSSLSYGIARLATVYGPRQRRDLEGGVVAIFVERLLARQPITIYGSGEQRRDFVHVADVVAALLAIADSDRDGTWNVATGTETSVNRLLEALQHELGPAVAVKRAPARAGEVFASSLSFARIAEDLGWRPGLDLAAGLRATIAWRPDGA